jgi:hypothetical protein
VEKYRNPRATEGESICNFVQTFGLSHLKRVLSCSTWLPHLHVFFTNKLHMVQVPSVVQIVRKKMKKKYYNVGTIPKSNRKIRSSNNVKIKGQVATAYKYNQHNMAKYLHMIYCRCCFLSIIIYVSLNLKLIQYNKRKIFCQLRFKGYDV